MAEYVKIRKDLAEGLIEHAKRIGENNATLKFEIAEIKKMKTFKDMPQASPEVDDKRLAHLAKKYAQEQKIDLGEAYKIVAADLNIELK